MSLSINGALPNEISEESEEYSQNPMSFIGEISRLMNNRLMEGETKNSLLQKSSRFIMLALSKRDGITQLDIVKITHLKAPTVSVTLQKLEKDGYIIRSPDNYDLRAMRVYLSNKGKKYNEYIINKVRTEENAILECLTQSESRQLLSLLNKIKQKMISDLQKNVF